MLHKSVGVDVWIVDIGAASVYHLAEVVCRDVGSHTYGDTIAAIDQEVRNLCRHNRRLHKGVVEVGIHIDGVLLEVVHDVLSHL